MTDDQPCAVCLAVVPQLTVVPEVKTARRGPSVALSCGPPAMTAPMDERRSLNVKINIHPRKVARVPRVLNT